MHGPCHPLVPALLTVEGTGKKISPVTRRIYVLAVDRRGPSQSPGVRAHLGDCGGRDAPRRSHLVLKGRRGDKWPRAVR